jgi:rRNA maturation protein Nop10
VKTKYGKYRASKKKKRLINENNWNARRDVNKS